MPQQSEISDSYLILLKMQSWCAYQERCQKDVLDKLYELKVPSQTADNIVCQLIENNFLNEERFAMLFVRSKFHVKKWGRIKIKSELKQRKIGDYVLRKALEQLDDDSYQETLKLLIENKRKLIKDKNPIQINFKLMNYALSKGYEKEIVMSFLKF
jgi:regulatory protein